MEESFEIVQGKLTGTAATWYQNRERLFDRHPSGLDEGWKNFWKQFEQKYIAQDEQALWMQFESSTQQADESVETYADALRRMADRLGVSDDGENIRMRFLKGLSNAQVRAKVENLTYLLAPTFAAAEAAVAHHEKTLRREKPQRGSVSNPSTSTTSTSETDRKVSAPEANESIRLKEESFHKIVLDLKRELAVQKQQIAIMQMDRLRQTKPDRPCFHCGSPDHFKRSCPDWLAQRGAVSQATMTDLFEMDLATIDEVVTVEEAIQRLQAYITDTEFTPSVARQVALIDVGEQEGLAFLSEAMSGCLIDEDNLSDDPDNVKEGEIVPSVREEAQRVLAIVQARKLKGLGTKMRDIVNDVEGQAAPRRGMEAMRRRQAQEKLRVFQQDNQEAAPASGGVYECLLPASVLTRKLSVVVDTGASHSIISFRTMRKLKPKSLMRPSKKAFITAAGELTFPVGEIAALPLTVGECTVKVNCLVVSKACFSILLGLDVMKPLGSVIDLQQDTFKFTDNSSGKRICVAMQCDRVKKTLNDVKVVSQAHQVRMLKPMPVQEGPVTGQSFFPELDELSPTARTTLQDYKSTPVAKMSQKMKTRI